MVTIWFTCKLYPYFLRYVIAVLFYQHQRIKFKKVGFYHFFLIKMKKGWNISYLCSLLPNPWQRPPSNPTSQTTFLYIISYFLMVSCYEQIPDTNFFLLNFIPILYQPHFILLKPTEQVVTNLLPGRLPYQEYLLIQMPQ